MHNIESSSNNFFVSSSLNRLSEHRNNKEWIAGIINSGKALFIAIYKLRMLISGNEILNAVFLKNDVLENVSLLSEAFIFLGEKGGIYY